MDKSGAGDRSKGARSGRDQRQGPGFLSEYSVDYKGQNYSVGVVLALRHERFKHKGVYTSFVDQVRTYILENYDNVSDILTILDQLTDPKSDIEKTEPKDLEGKDVNSEVKKWKKQAEVRKYFQRLTDLENNQEKLYGLVWGQCSNRLQELIKADEEFEEKSRAYDYIWLLKKCKMILSGVDEQANKYSTLIKALTSLCTIRQGESESNDSFRKRVDAYVLTLKLLGGEHILWSPQLIKSNNKKDPSKDEIEVEEDKFKAMLMILRADHIRYGALQESLFQGVYKGRNDFPQTITKAYDLLQHIASEVPSYTRTQSTGRRCFGLGRGSNRSFTNVTFTQRTSSNDDVVTGIDRKVFPCIMCHNCGKKGHFRDKCNVVAGKAKQTKVTLAHFTLTQKGLEIINKDWVLLDTGLTVSVFCNKDLVHNIWDCKLGQGITVITNGGSQSFHQEAEAKLLPITVHFNEDSLANILSLSDVANLPGARITMDSLVERSILLHFQDKTIKFIECAEGLYVCNMKNNTFNINTKVTNYSPSLIQTVDSNKAMFTKRDVIKADNARRLQHIIGWPSDTQFQNIISNNQIINCDTSIDNIHRAKVIYGPAPELLSAKMTRPPDTSSSHLKQLQLPPQFLSNYPTIQLYIDFFTSTASPFYTQKGR